MWYDKGDQYSKTSFWCTSYTDTNCAWNNYAFYSGQYSTDPEEAAEATKTGRHWSTGSVSRFYIIIPKDIKYVPDKKYAKVNVQVAGSTIRVWDTDDRGHDVDEPEIKSLFDSWQIPLKKPKGRGEE
jgi:hypothetical protein